MTFSVFTQQLPPGLPPAPQALATAARRLLKALVSLLLVAALMPARAQADDYAEVSKLAASGAYAEALAKADGYLSSKPRDPQMRFLRGVILTDSGRSADAITAFTLLTEDFPELPEPYNNLAVLHAAQGQLDKARTLLEAALRGNPNYATAHENLGDVHARLASQAYAKALALDPRLSSAQAKQAALQNLLKPAAR